VRLRIAPERPFLALLALLFLLPTPSVTQPPAPTETLAIAGYPGTVPVIRVNGKSYVGVEALARLTGGSLTLQPNRITLTLPNNPASPPRKETGFSRDFVRAVIEEMALIREWRVALANAVQHNYPVSENWIGNYRRTAESRLALVSAAVTTESDRNCLPMVQNEFNTMQRLTNRFLALHESLTYVATDSVDKDPLNQKVLDCARSLGSVTLGSQFQDIPACF
jgi:hypothetical protein